MFHFAMYIQNAHVAVCTTVVDLVNLHELPLCRMSCWGGLALPSAPPYLPLVGPRGNRWQISARLAVDGGIAFAACRRPNKPINQERESNNGERTDRNNTRGRSGSFFA